MRKLANYCEARERCKVKTYKKDNGQIKMEVGCEVGDPRFDFPPEVTLKVRIPRKGRIRNVFDGEKELDRDKWHVAGRFMILALSFERSLKEVRILTES